MENEQEPEVNLDRVIRLIQNLMAKTTARGASEAEAMAAAEKVTELLNKYQLDMSDISLKQGEMHQDFMDTEVKTPQPIEYCLNALAYLLDLKVWKVSGAGKWGGTHHRFFGYQSDVIVAKYLYNIIARALVFEWQDYCREHPDNKGPKAKKSFHDGMTYRISVRLREMKDRQRKSNFETTGRDLVLVKKPVVDEAWAKLGIYLSKGRGRSGGSSDPYAWSKGAEAGDRVKLNPGVDHKGPGGLLN